MDVTITADALADALAGPTPPVLLDVRWSLAEPDGRPAYRTGHVPGAVFVDLETELARRDHEPSDGRHPLPEEAAFTAAMRRWGIRAGDAVVAYDDLGNQSAARAWWLLRHAGVADVRLLDGGLGAWRSAGFPLEAGEVQPTLGDATARYGHLPVLDIDGAERMPRSGVLLDARATARYRGELDPVDPVAGHIPGAASAPTAGNLDADGRFLPADVLRDRYAALGVVGGRPVAAYCGSGVTAAHAVAALAIAGVDAALYPGSWSQWANSPGRPVETGGA